jgi:OOP family OmpA-OmpF porin
MRKLAIAALLVTTMATPALARDGNWYVGVEGGALKAQRAHFDYTYGTTTQSDAINVKWKTGYDVDGLIGYDFGALRAEAEVGYKRNKADDIIVSFRGPIVVPPTSANYEARSRVLSSMFNLLGDFGSDQGISGFVGGGVGLSRTKIRADFTPFSVNGSPLGVNGTDRRFAWQAIAGVRAAVTDNVDIGLKYRYFATKVRFDDTGPQGVSEEVSGRYRSHSLLASLIFNFGSPPVAPPPPPLPPSAPPPPPPATQTCPDGSVILATDQCSAPLPPPPPPAPAPERG